MLDHLFEFEEETVVETRVCIYCNEAKTLDCFHPHPTGGLGGYDSRCKQCKSKHSSITWRLKKENPKPKNAVCDCCGNPGKKTHGKNSSDGIVLDHCHDTGIFRGWLCQKCNRGLGCFGDSIQGLELGIKYLNKVKEKC